MKKYLFRLMVSVCAIVLAFGAITVSAATGVYDGTVNFPCINGDVTDDGKVNLVDLVRLKKYIADNKVEIFEDAADLDGDGLYNSVDLTAIRKILLK